MEKRVYLQEAFLIITFSLYEAKQICILYNTNKSVPGEALRQSMKNNMHNLPEPMAPFSIQKKVLRVNNRFGYAIPADRGY